jgi:hypothetical protein
MGITTQVLMGAAAEAVDEAKRLKRRLATAEASAALAKRSAAAFKGQLTRLKRLSSVQVSALKGQSARLGLELERQSTQHAAERAQWLADVGRWCRRARAAEAERDAQVDEVARLRLRDQICDAALRSLEAQNT